MMMARHLPDRPAEFGLLWPEGNPGSIVRAGVGDARRKVVQTRGSRDFVMRIGFFTGTSNRWIFPLHFNKTA